jgi:uncharacterized protein
MHRLKLIILALTFLVAISSEGRTADLQKGLSAYKKKDYATALRELVPLAERGNPIAQSSLGAMYRSGRGVSQDYKTAVKWYRLAARQGFAEAQFKLGVAYDQGHGVPQDEKTAVKWYRLSAEQGDKQAQFNLGVMYELA